MAVSIVAVSAGPLEPSIAKRLGQTLEARIPRADLSAAEYIDGIIVLGGSSTRVAAALHLAERFPDAPVVLSGPGAAEVTLARSHLGRSNRLLIDDRATTTYENAYYSRELLAPVGGERWVVVTSAVHMPRAMGAFKAVGMRVLPWPVGDTPKTAAALSASVWHEVVGLLGYWVLGRSSELFPGVYPGGTMRTT